MLVVHTCRVLTSLVILVRPFSSCIANTESVVISDHENAYAGLILASKSFSSSGEGAKLYSMWSDTKDKEAWHQVGVAQVGVVLMGTKE